MSKPRAVTQEALDVLVKSDIPLSRVEGTGPGLVVTAADVIRAVEQDERDAAVYFALWPDPAAVVPPLSDEEQQLYAAVCLDGGVDGIST